MRDDNFDAEGASSAGEKGRKDDDLSSSEAIHEPVGGAEKERNSSEEYNSEDPATELGPDGRGDLDRDEAIQAELVDDVTEGDPGKRQKISRIIEMSTHRGPLPSATEFARYEQVYPGAAAAILKMAGEASEANAELVKAEAEQIRTNARIDEKTVPRGQWISGGLTFGVLLLAGLALFLGNSAFAFIFGAGGVGLMVMNVVPILMGSREPKNSQDQKAIENE